MRTSCLTTGFDHVQSDLRFDLFLINGMLAVCAHTIGPMLFAATRDIFAFRRNNYMHMYMYMQLYAWSPDPSFPRYRCGTRDYKHPGSIIYMYMYMYNNIINYHHTCRYIFRDSECPHVEQHAGPRARASGKLPSKIILKWCARY